MERNPGVLIVLEGSDGSGKGTQYRLLFERLEAVGYDVEKFDFPRYDEPSSYFVKRYLNGDYGPASQVGPYTASFFYALDRYEAAPKIRQALADGKVVLCNRYVGSNMAHQGSKFISAAEQRGFFVWADSLEFQLLGIPRPNLNIFLKVPAEMSQKLIGQKAGRNYTDKTHDEHESDIAHLRSSVAAYDLMCQLFPKDFVAIDCVGEGKLLSIPEVNNLIWNIVKSFLPSQPPRTPRGKTVNLNESTTSLTYDSLEQPEAQLKVAEPTSQLKLKKVSGLAERSLFGQALASVSEVSMNSQPKYYTPKALDASLLGSYRIGLGGIDIKRRELEQKLTKINKVSSTGLVKMNSEITDVLANLMPLGQLKTLVLSGTSRHLSQLAVSLAGGNFVEMQEISNTISQETKDSSAAKSQSPSSGAKKSGALISDLLDQLGESLAGDEPVRLSAVWPKNEFELLAEVLYPRSGSSLEQLNQNIGLWSFRQKLDVLNELFTTNDQALLDSLKSTNYRFDVVSAGNDAKKLLSFGGWRNIRVQSATPRYGYDIPEIVEQAGLEEEYSECFDVSLNIFNELQAAGFFDEAQYAVLEGHKMRWQADIDALSLLSVLMLQDAPDVPKSLKQVLAGLKEAALLAHPVIFDLNRSSKANKDNHLFQATIAKRQDGFDAKPIGPSPKTATGRRAGHRRRGRPKKS